jgi:tetratricopeptide (TPR) repeat protein
LQPGFVRTLYVQNFGIREELMIRKIALAMVVAIVSLMGAAVSAQADASDILDGYSYYGEGEYDDALDAFDEAIDDEEDEPAGYVGKGLVLSAMERYDEAVAAFDMAVKLKPDANTFNLKGINLAALGRFEEAVSAYDKAIELEPGNASAYSLRGLSLLGLGRKEEAKASYAKAHELDPELEVPEGL